MKKKTTVSTVILIVVLFVTFSLTACGEWEEIPVVRADRADTANMTEYIGTNGDTFYRDADGVIYNADGVLPHNCSNSSLRCGTVGVCETPGCDEIVKAPTHSSDGEGGCLREGCYETYIENEYHQFIWSDGM